MKKLERKKAIITGGTTGFGFETAKSFLAEGAEVLITGRSQPKIDEALSRLGKNAYGLKADATILADLEKLAEKAKTQFGQVDVLFVNAGQGVFGALEDVTEESYYQEFDLNVKGVFFSVQKILPLLKKGSSVILTSS